MPPDEAGADFPVVGVGASAGGLEPLEELFSHVPADVGMAFIVVQHSDPTHTTLLPEILSRRSPLPVSRIVEGESPEPNRIYICPSDAYLSIVGRLFVLTPRTKKHEPILAIDRFFRTLATEYENCAMGVVLSGSGSDGALGLLEIKEKGGMTFAQDAASSKFPSMPQSAAATGAVDFVLPAKAIAEQLVKMAKHTYLRSESQSVRSDLIDYSSPDFQALLGLIHKKSGVDFRQYKHGTVSRRISRRMALYNIHSAAKFVEFLKENPEALHALGHDILIQVTKFFREPEMFDLLKQTIFPMLLQKKEATESLRIWVPGCSSGEEVYSLLICLLEFIEDGGYRSNIQVFGTDLSEAAVAKARAASYFENIALDVSVERLGRFFSKVGNRYEIHKSLRDMCIFAKHNVVTDPPFGKLDLISCRNLLIYLEPPLQNRALSIFHYALKPRGVLVLGNSETVAGVADLYTVLDTRNRFYEKKHRSSRLYFDFVGAHNTVERLAAPISAPPQAEGASKGIQMQRDADRFLMGEFVPASVIINDSLEVIQFRGKTGPYFEHSPGFASFDLLGMLRDGLGADVRAAVEAARSKKQSARKEGIRIKTEGESHRVAVEVFPMVLPSTGERYFIILFEEMDQPKFKMSKLRRRIFKSVRPTEDETQELKSIRSELASTKEYLQSVNEEKEATNEELKAANEEIMSSNEELQSTNEELHSAKEELQSTNEELITVNDELKLRNQDLSHLNDDLSNLFNSLNSAMVLLTKDLRVRRFTPMAESLLRLIPGDVGRSIIDIRANVEIGNLQGLLREVIATAIPKEMETVDEQGHWYSVQMTVSDRR